MATNDTLKSRKDAAIKIVNEIKEQSYALEKNLQKSKRIVSEMVVDSANTKKLNTSLQRIIKTTNEAISKFRTEREKVSRLLTQINNFHDNKYLPLVNKINDDNTGFKARLKQGTQFKNETLRLRESSKNQYEQIKKYASELKKTYKELNSIDSLIRKLLLNSTNKNTKVNELSSHIFQLDSKITQAHKNIESLLTKSQANEKSILELSGKADGEFEEITDIKLKSEKLLAEIQDVYEIAYETGLSGEFDKRRKHLKELLAIWEKRIFITTIVLLGVIIMIFVGQLWLYNWDIESHTFDINFYVRFLLASPIVYYLYFCSSQYGQTKKLHDRYSFKTTLAMSIKHHIQLLTQHEKFNTDERINTILEFVLEGFQKIYSEPHTNDDYKLKMKLANIELEIEKRLMETITKTIGLKQDKYT